MSRITCVTLALALLAANPASAQTAAPASAGNAGLGGPVVAGVCLLSREAIFANAKIGVAASTRLKQISDEAQVEVDAQRKPVDADVQAFQKEAAKLTPEQRTTRQQALATRLQPVQQLAAQRSREIEATRNKGLQQISTEAQPVIAQVYRQRGCGLLIDRSTVMGGNFANDLTADVVKGLDAKVTTISLNRETLPPVAEGATRP
ncbi:MAG: OmpH family outer membrane protein [Sphingomonas sp.]|jgi:Skp family chaperone for outer membrane proteins|uniref:OmpH family outer membrane protein n=1 Tax=Sphingomonas sp. TaxID=28214 RepID=UPI0035673EF0